MIKYKVTAGEITIELECQTIGELIEYLDYDKETVEVRKEPLVWDNRLIGLKDSPSFFVRPNQTVHFPKTETFNGELWYVNDGQQPVGDDVMVDVLFKNKQECHCVTAGEWEYGEDGEVTITHWRLAK